MPQLCVRGPGTCAFNAHGGLHRFELAPGETLSVDNGHVVAWSPSCQMEIGWAAQDVGLFTSITSGEGLVCRFKGPGEVWVQTHVGPTHASTSR